MQFGLPSGVPQTEFSEEFIQLMRNRMATSFFKYGAVYKNFPSERAVQQIRARLEKYLETGNTEWLCDAANFCMIEWMFPTHQAAHFQATDGDASPEKDYKPPAKASEELKRRMYREGD